MTYNVNGELIELTVENGIMINSRCSFIFKKFLHETPMTYVARLRLQKSLTALLDSDKNISADRSSYIPQHIRLAQ